MTTLDFTNDKLLVVRAATSTLGKVPVGETIGVAALAALGKALITPMITVAAMVAAPANTLAVGQTVQTLGYYAMGDGGGQLYRIVAGGTGTHDGGSFINLTASGLQAQAVFAGNVIPVEAFGCVDGRECSAAWNAANAYALASTGYIPGATSVRERPKLTCHSNILIKDPIYTSDSSGRYMDTDFTGAEIRVTTGGTLSAAPTTPALTVRGQSSAHFLCPVICDKQCSGTLVTAVQNSAVFAPAGWYCASNANAYGVKISNARGSVVHHPVAVEWGSAWAGASVAANYLAKGVVIDGQDFEVVSGHVGWSGVAIYFSANSGYVRWDLAHPYCNKAIITGLDSGGNATTNVDAMVSYTDVRQDPIAILSDSPMSNFIGVPYVDGGYVVDNTGCLQISGGLHYMSPSAAPGVSNPYTRIKDVDGGTDPKWTMRGFRSTFGLFTDVYTTLSSDGASWSSFPGLVVNGRSQDLYRQHQMFYTGVLPDGYPHVVEIGRAGNDIRKRQIFGSGYIEERSGDSSGALQREIKLKTLRVTGDSIGQTVTYLLLGDGTNGFRWDPSTGYLNTMVNGTARWRWSSLDYLPTGDGTGNVGSATNRVGTYYGATGAINTSDEREKSGIAAIDDAALDAWGQVEFTQFQFADAVEAKGDGARIHVGVIAQRVVAAFAARGLDAARYGLLCHDQWKAAPALLDTVRVVTTPAVIDVDGNEVSPAVYEDRQIELQPARPAGDRYGIRYEEALTLEAAYQRRRADRLEAALAAITARVAAIETKLN